MSVPSIGDVPIPDNDPYTERVNTMHPAAPERSPRCPVCGSPHHTVFRSLVKNHENNDVISGDLTMRNIMVFKCLSCGHSAPIVFSMVRDM